MKTKVKSGGFSSAAETTKLARTAGLREFGTPRLEEVNKRRSQLWVLSLVVGLIIPAGIAALAFDLLPDRLSGLLDLRTVQLGLLALLVALFGYVAEREVALRKLTKSLFEERELTDALVSRVQELDLLFKAARAMNSTLALGPVLDMILDSAYELLRANAGSISLVAIDDVGELEVAAVRGEEDMTVGDRSPVKERLGNTEEAMLVMDEEDGPRTSRPVGSELIVPLQHRGQFVGLLHLTSSAERPFTEFHLRSVAVFAETASAAISNARLHESMQATVEQLCELDRMKDDFLAMLTHELRSPLTSIIGILSTLERGLGGELGVAQLSELVSMARNQGWRLDRLVDDLLETASMQNGGPRLKPAEADARTAVARAIRALATQAEEHHLEVKAPSEPLVCSLDTEAVTRILTNLVGNAVKHTPPGTTITVEVEPWHDGVCLTVSDDGPGIPQAERERIFEKFQRGTPSAGTDGLGLGLHIVKTLAEAHGGDIRLAESEAGARFVARLPALAGESANTITV